MKGIEYLINVGKCCIFDPKKIIIVTIIKAVELINKDAKKTLLLILLNSLFFNKLNKIIKTKNKVIINIELYCKKIPPYKSELVEKKLEKTGLIQGRFTFRGWLVVNGTSV